jgi:hypothetical protein
LATEALLEGEAETLTRKAIDLALDGDVTALRLCLERICPPRKGRTLRIPLEAPNDAAGVVGALSDLIHSLGKGSIDTEEAAAVAALLEGHRRALETNELEQRLAEIEDRLEEGGK